MELRAIGQKEANPVAAAYPHFLEHSGGLPNPPVKVMVGDGLAGNLQKHLVRIAAYHPIQELAQRHFPHRADSIRGAGYTCCHFPAFPLSVDAGAVIEDLMKGRELRSLPPFKLSRANGRVNRGQWLG